MLSCPDNKSVIANTGRVEKIQEKITNPDDDYYETPHDAPPTDKAPQPPNVPPPRTSHSPPPCHSHGPPPSIAPRESDSPPPYTDSLRTKVKTLY